MGNDVIVDAFIAVIVGGLGSLRGAVVGALLVGMAELMGALVIPGMAKAAVYVAVAIVMIIKPAGLFGSDRSCRGHHRRTTHLFRNRGRADLVDPPTCLDRLFNAITSI